MPVPERTCCARVILSEIAPLCVPETDSSSCAKKCGKELETDPSSVFEAELQHVRLLCFWTSPWTLLLLVHGTTTEPTALTVSRADMAQFSNDIHRNT